MTGKQIINKLIKLELDPQTISNEYWSTYLDIREDDEEFIEKYYKNDEFDSEKFLKDEDIEFKRIHQEYNNNASDVSLLILHFTKHDVYLRAFGYYNSYDGDNFDDAEWEIVVPEEKKITIFTTKK